MYNILHAHGQGDRQAASVQGRGEWLGRNATVDWQILRTGGRYNTRDTQHVAVQYEGGL